MKKIKAFTRLVKPLARIWTRAKAYWLGCTRNPTTRVSPLVKTHAEPSSTIGLSHPSFASAHSYGFTLAEVLITLTILGVVAAITVPSLQKMNYKRTQVSRMAKAYSSLEKAATNIATNTNCIGKDLKCTGLLDITDSGERMNKFIELSGFRVTKKYNSSYIKIRSLSYKKFPNDLAAYLPVFITTPDNLAYNITKTTMHIYDPKAPNTIGDAPAIFIYAITDKHKLYDNDGNVIPAHKGYTDAVMGRDVFLFVMYDNFKVEPASIAFGGGVWPLSQINKNVYFKDSSINGYCNPDATNSSEARGGSCTARIIRDGWKMKY